MEKKDKRRLHFGVVFPSLDNTDKYNLLQDIEDYAVAHDIHLTAYFGIYEENNTHYASHYEPCFEAIKRNIALDGVIIYSGFIAHNVGIDKFLNYVNSILECFPVVSIGLQIPGTYCVMSDHMSGMYKAVSHLIKDDGKKHIVFIKGPIGHPEAEARLAGYLKALSDNGIGRDDNLILQGDFTPRGGELAVEELLDKRKVKFDAVCCCNDETALGFMRGFKQRGFSVPQDAAIIGFDDVNEAATFQPPLSTIRQDFSKLGTIASDTLSCIIRKENAETVTNVEPELIIRRSCGCNKKERHTPLYQDNANAHERVRRMVTDSLLLEFNLESLGDLIKKSLPLIALDFALVGVYHAPIKTANGNRSIRTLFGFDGEHKINDNDLDETPYPFSDCSGIKNVNFERERRTLFFLPLFFGDEERGAALIDYNKFNPINWYETLRTNIAAVVKGASLLEEIQTLSVTDELTGLYNRRGFMQQVRTKLQYLLRQPDYIHVIYAMDMDGLKKINDTYGHTEGDVAIYAFADILRTSVRMEDIVSRLGGDEFVIYSVVKSESDIHRLENRIRQKLDDYNAQEKHPYAVMGSIGVATLTKPTDAAFNQAMQNADNALYVEKQKKREKGLSRK